MDACIEAVTANIEEEWDGPEDFCNRIYPSGETPVLSEERIVNISDWNLFFKYFHSP